MLFIVTGILMAVVSAFGFMYLKDIKETDKNINTRGKWFAFSLLVYTAVDVVTAVILSRHDCGIISVISTLILLNAMFLLAVIDFRHKMIPNKYISGLVIIRAVLIVCEGIVKNDFIEILIGSLIGMLIGFMILGITALVSGKNLGGGDVKMYAVIGFFTGGSAVLDVLIYSSVICALTGLLLVVMKKCSMKSLVPMAPFAFVGTVLYVLLGA